MLDPIDTNLSKLTSLSSSIVGRKACAMVYFKSRNLFPSHLQVIPPSATKDVIHKASSFPHINSGYTLRFSRESDIGLPRLFLKTHSELIQALQHFHNPNWATIIHPYFRVSRSFELNITKKSLALEHVPGMWESDNKVSPDLLFSTRGGTTCFLYNKYRVARLHTFSGNMSGESTPISSSLANSWMTKLFPISDTIHRDFDGIDAINLHFIEASQNEWIFLNIRSGYSDFSLTKAPPSSALFKVENLSDLEKWDKKQPLLISLALTRGSERNIIPYFVSIRPYASVLHIEFGILSHPAIILRELGFKLIPFHKASQDNSLENYDECHFKTLRYKHRQDRTDTH